MKVASGQPSAAEFVPVTTDLAELRAAADHCRGCHLHENATQVVFGAGPPSARVVMVGEQPGDVEDRRGEPFVGPAAKALFGPSFRVTQSRGEVLPWPGSARDPGEFPETGGFAVATVHPSAVLRADDRDQAFNGLVADLKVVAGQL